MSIDGGYTPIFDLPPPRFKPGELIAAKEDGIYWWRVEQVSKTWLMPVYVLVRETDRYHEYVAQNRCEEQYMKPGD